MGGEEHYPQAASEYIESDSGHSLCESLSQTRSQPGVLACTSATHCVIFLLSQIGSDLLSNAVIRERVPVTS